MGKGENAVYLLMQCLQKASSSGLLKLEAGSKQLSSILILYRTTLLTIMEKNPENIV